MGLVREIQNEGHDLDEVAGDQATTEGKILITSGTWKCSRKEEYKNV